MSPASGRILRELDEFEFCPEGDVILVFFSKEKSKADDNGDTPESTSSSGTEPTPSLAPVEEAKAVRTEMTLSSVVLKLASPVFKPLLEPPFKEGLALQTDGKVKIELPEDDPKAFAVWANMIHSHYGRVSDELSLNLLGNFIILVDKYQVPPENLRFVYYRWADAFERHVLERERMDTKDLLQAIGIAWKLKASKSFKHLTKILRTRDEKVTLKEYDDEDLCLTLLPEKVLNSIKELQIQHRRAIINLPMKWVNDYHSGVGGVRCSCHDPECDMLAIRMLLRIFYPRNTLLDILNPQQDLPAPREIYKAYLGKARTISYEITCQGTGYRHDRNAPDRHRIKDQCVKELVELVVAQDGLNIEDFA